MVKTVTTVTLLIASVVVVVAVWSSMRSKTAQEVSDVATSPEQLVGAFRRAVLEENGKEAEAAYEAMKKIGPPMVIPVTQLLDDEVETVRVYGAELLQELIEEVREQGAHAKTPAEIRQTIPILMDKVVDPNEKVRSEAVSALGWIGSDAEVAIATVRQALNDPSQRVRDKAARALRRIETDSLDP